jgi:hypothetical protein
MQERPVSVARRTAKPSTRSIESIVEARAPQKLAKEPGILWPAREPLKKDRAIFPERERRVFYWGT